MQTQKKQVKQKIVSTCIILFLIVMVTGTVSVDLLSAATGANMTLNQVLNPGPMFMEAPAAMVFSPLNVGMSGNSVGSIGAINACDFRGSGAGWSITGFANALTRNGATNNTFNTIPNTAISIFAAGTPSALAGSLTAVTAGTPTLPLNTPRTFLTATAGNGMGNYQLTGTQLQVSYNGRPDQAAGYYGATVTFNMI